ncbi:MAG: TolC family protein [Chlorobiaceae bacterium]|nr:TolC family protein [Chlorobiaceae bacterium]NTW10464.1 TolC family protein [Chlorobiaceae bacterium]
MNVCKILVIVALLASATGSLEAKDARSTLKLSLDEALMLARENNFTIKAAKSRVAQAEAKITQTRQSSLPKVTLVENAVVTNDPGAALVFKLQQNIVETADFNPAKLNNADVINDFNTSLQVMQPIFNADANVGRTIARSARTAQEYMAGRTVEAIELQVSKLYYGLILARRNIEAVDQSITAMQSHNRVAVAAFNNGMMSKSDKLSTGVRVAELNEQKLMLHDAVKNASDALKSLLDIDSDVLIVPAGDFVIDKGLPRIDGELVPETRKDLLAMQSFRDIAAKRTEMARAARLPRVNGFLRTDLHSNVIIDSGSSWMMGLNVQWDLFDGMASEGKIREAKAQELEARYNYEEAKNGSLVEIRKSLREMKTAKARIVVAREALDEAKVSLDYTGTQFRSGMAMTFELLMRESAYTFAKLRLNQARYDYCIARSELAYYAGKQ